MAVPIVVQRAAHRGDLRPDPRLSDSQVFLTVWTEEEATRMQCPWGAVAGPFGEHWMTEPAPCAQWVFRGCKHNILAQRPLGRCRGVDITPRDEMWPWGRRAPRCVRQPCSRKAGLWQRYHDSPLSVREQRAHGPSFSVRATWEVWTSRLPQDSDLPRGEEDGHRVERMSGPR